MANNATDSRRYEMPSHLRLGPDKDGHVFVEKWKGDMYTYSAAFFDDLTECFQDDKPRDWMTKLSTFQYYKRTANSEGEIVLATRASNFPKPEAADYDEAVEDRKVWRDKKQRFEQKAPAIITFLLNGTMCNDSRDRL